MSEEPGTAAEQVLKALGLNRVCIQVYLMAHSAPDANAEQIAELLSLGSAEVADALDELSDLTLVRPGLSSARRFRPVSIERAVQALLRQQAAHLDAQSRSLSMLQSAMKGLLESKPEREDSYSQVNIETIIGVEEAQSLIDQLCLRATESVYSSMPGGNSMSPEMLEAAKPVDEDMCQRGVQIRALYQNAIKSDRRVREYVRWLAGLGAGVRFAPVVPTRLLLIDQSAAVLLRKDPNLPTEMFVVREPAILRPLIELYELYWNAAESLDEERPRQLDGKAPTAQELALLRLLASGSTDEAAGKKLGISVRTVRRIMADLMERLEASSRFEAGHKATQRGWL
jgi:DNA-binding CsgD family transcriptional regulator/sugar-specific transcriptional regulator TrmB